MVPRDVQVTAAELLAFEEEIASEFRQGKIRSPIHLSAGNEDELITIFAGIEPQDWVLCAWRSHYHCLLKGVPREKLKDAILAGRSISLCFPEHKIICSGIVGGIAPIAVGLAWGCRRRNEAAFGLGESKVYCFIGDMTAETGIAHEATKYAARHGLPVKWIVEDNGLSVMTPTQTSWGNETAAKPDVHRYGYKLGRPHSGIGEWVRF